MSNLPIAVIAIIILGAGAYWYTTTDEPATDTTPSDVVRTPETETETDTEPTTAETDTPDSDNGTQYSATAQYLTPAREPHDVTVDLTVTDGTVTDVNVLYNGSKDYANQHQESFDAEIADAVVGVSLADVSADRIGGASLTSGAFNDAIEDIRSEATTS